MSEQGHAHSRGVDALIFCFQTFGPERSTSSHRAGIELSVLSQMEKMSVLTVIVLEATDAPGPVHPRTICSVSRLGERERTLMPLLVHDGAMDHR